MLIISLEYTSESHKSYCAYIYIYFFTVWTNNTTFKLQKARIQNKQFAVYISETPATLKQSAGHQTYDGNSDPKQGYNNAKFESSCFNGVRNNANVKFVLKQENVLIISLEHVQK